VEAHEAFVAKFGLERGMAEDTADGWRVRFECQLMHLPVDRFWAAVTADEDAPAVGGPPPRPPGRPSWPAWSSVAGAEGTGYRPLEVNTEELRVPHALEAAP
jgi:hypothetical protein